MMSTIAVLAVVIAALVAAGCYCGLLFMLVPLLIVDEGSTFFRLF